MIRRFPLALLAVACASTALVNLVTPATAAPGDISSVAGSQGGGVTTNVAMEPAYLAMAGPLLYIGDSNHNVVRVLDTRTDVTRVVAGNGYSPPHAVAQVGDGAP